MLRILVISHHFPPEVNGTATRVFEIVKRLISINPNLRVYVLTPVPSRPFGRFKQVFKYLNMIKSGGNKVIVFRVWNFQPQSVNPPRIHRIMNYVLFPLIALVIGIALMIVSDIVIVVTPPTPVCLFAIVARMLNKVVIIDITDLWHEEAEQLGYIDKRYKLLMLLSRGLEIIAIRLSKIVTTASRIIMKYYVAFSNKKFVVLPTPIDTTLIKKYCSEDQILDKDELIIYAGNFGKPQALHLAIIAFSFLKRSSDNIKKMIFIGGGEEPELRRLIHRMKLNEFVKVLSPVPREELFKAFYRKAKVGLVPLAFSKSMIYAIPTKLYEYLACGLPFVSYGYSLELRYLALVSKAGIHVNKNDPLEIAKAIKYVFEHWEQLSKRAKAYFDDLMKVIEHRLKMILEFANE